MHRIYGGIEKLLETVFTVWHGIEINANKPKVISIKLGDIGQTISSLAGGIFKMKAILFYR